MSGSTSELRVRSGPFNMFKTSSNIFTDLSKAVGFFWGFFLLFMIHVCLSYAVWSVPCSLVITCWKKADHLALLCVILSLVFFHFPICSSGSGMVLDCIDS